jgi:predicted membrane metal-binding protein
MERFKKLAINTGLAFVAGATTAFLALISTTPKEDLKAFLIAVVLGAIFAGVRAAIGFLALQIPQVPAIPVDE